METTRNDNIINYYGIWQGEPLEDEELDKRFRWLIEHLASDHGGQKKRSVCPWSVSAFKEDRFYIGDARHINPTLEDVNLVIEAMQNEYESYGSFSPYNNSPATLTISMPDKLDAETIIKALELYRLKLTPLGLMLGALDPFNTLISLTGGKGYPYKAPWNFFTIRWMVACDSIFLDLNADYRKIYIDFFGSWPYDKNN